MRKERFRLLYVLPVLGLLAAALLPQIVGTGTLYLRDTLTSHYPLKASQALSLRQAELPLVDVHRGGGQPMLGNPNILPLYPTNLLYLVASPLWALNAHFWIHLLLAPFCFYLLGRVWGLSRPAAWAAGTCYALSGFMLSQLNFYNLVAGAALTPAFIAAMVGLWRAKTLKPWSEACAGLLWALLLLAGDPFFAVMAFGMALTAAVLRHRKAPLRPLRLLATITAATALTAPQWVEFLRILPLSLRGHWGFSIESAFTHSLDPRTAIEWFLPLFFGRPEDLGFWGLKFYGGLPPLFFSLAPGTLVVALALSAARTPAERRRALWPWCMVVLGAFLVLGGWNPALWWIYKLPGASMMRFPVKFWLLIAVGISLLCGLGFERLLRGRGMARRWLEILAALYLALGLFVLSPAGEMLRGLSERFAGDGFGPERARWLGLCLLGFGLTVVLRLILALPRRRDVQGALLLTVHVAGQLLLLRPLYESRPSAPLREPPPRIEAIPNDARIAHGAFQELFGPQRISPIEMLTGPAALPDLNMLTAIHVTQLYPFAGIPQGLRYELNYSPEWLDSFFTISLAKAMKQMDDSARVRILAASGVDLLLLDRPLEFAAWSQVQERTRIPTGLGNLYVYDVLNAAPPAFLARQVLRAPHMNAAVDFLTHPSFEAGATAVLPGTGDATALPGGEARLLSESADEILVEVAGAGLLVVRRTYLDIYRAAALDADGQMLDELEIETANFHRLAVQVPPGTAQVRIWADRGPTRQAWAVALAGLLGLVLLALRRPWPEEVREP